MLLSPGDISWEHKFNQQTANISMKIGKYLQIKPIERGYFSRQRRLSSVKIMPSNGVDDSAIPWKCEEIFEIRCVI